MPEASGRLFSFLDHLTFVEDDSSSYEIGISNEGFSYLDRVSEKKARQITFQEKQRRETSAALDGSTRARGKLNIRKLEKIDHDAISIDTDLASIIQDLQERNNKTAFFPIVFIVVTILFLGWCFLPDMMAKILVGIFFFPSALIVLLNISKFDQSRRHAKLTYRFSGEGQAAFQSINQGLERLAKSEQILLLCGRNHFEDTRYSGGAESLPQFKVIQMDRVAPPLIEINSLVWHLRASRRDFYFMPDHLLVYDGSNIGGINYAKLEMQSLLDTTQARETAKRTSDCKVIGKTHRFVNNDGTPDQRFNNNIQIPIIEYGVFSISGSGLDIRLYSSMQNAGTSAPREFKAIQRLGRKPVIAIAEERRKKIASTLRKPPEFSHVLLNLMCCIMVSDGRLSKSEKEVIKKTMGKFQPSYTPEKTISEIDFFCQRINKEGYSTVVKSACNDLKILKEHEKVDSIMSALESIAMADGQIKESEQKILNLFRTTVRQKI